MAETETLGTSRFNTKQQSIAPAEASYDSALVLFQPETNEIIVVEKKNAKAFLEEANQMEKLCRDLLSAREAVLDLEAQIATESALQWPNNAMLEDLNRQLGPAMNNYEATYKEIKQELGDEGYLTDLEGSGNDTPKSNQSALGSKDKDYLSKGAGSGKKMLELIPLATKKTGSDTKEWNRKWTYVRSDKVKNHWRSYKLNDAEHNQPGSFIKDGKFDMPTFKKQMDHVVPKLKAEWGLYKQGFLSEGLQGWADTLNRTASPDKPFQFGWRVHLLRYFVGCGVGGEWNPKAGKIAGKVNGKAELMLAYGELTSNGYLPDADGWAWALPGVKSGKEYLIGCIRFKGGLKLTGAAGASIAAELSLEVDYSGALPNTKGSHRPKNTPVGQKKIALDKFDPGGNLGGEAFAGVKAGCEIVGGLEFRNPEKGSEFKYMAQIGPKLEAQAGAGIAGHFWVHYEKGKFRLRAKAGLCLGLGAKGEISLEVDARQIYNFLEWLFHALLNANFEFLEVVSTEAFKRATQLQAMLVNGVENAYDDVVGKWDKFQEQLEREDRRVALMKRVLTNPPELRICTPEAHGILLHELTRHGKLTYLDFDNTGWNFETFGERKKAVLRVCQWAQSKRQLENMVQHIGPTGMERKGSFKGNFEGLKRFMEIGPLNSDYDDKLQVLYDSLPKEPDRGYGVKEAAPKKLYMGDSPIYRAMLRGRG